MILLAGAFFVMVVVSYCFFGIRGSDADMGRELSVFLREDRDVEGLNEDGVEAVPLVAEQKQESRLPRVTICSAGPL